MNLMKVFVAVSLFVFCLPAMGWDVPDHFLPHHTQRKVLFHILGEHTQALLNGQKVSRDDRVAIEAPEIRDLLDLSFLMEQQENVETDKPFRVKVPLVDVPGAILRPMPNSAALKSLRDVFTGFPLHPNNRPAGDVRLPGTLIVGMMEFLNLRKNQFEEEKSPLAATFSEFVKDKTVDEISSVGESTFEKKNRLPFVEGYSLGSRSIVFRIDDSLYSMKMPTSGISRRSARTNTKILGFVREAEHSIEMSRHVRNVNSQLAIEHRSNYPFLEDILFLFPHFENESFRSDRTEGGVLIRDLNSMKNDYLYMPAFSIPFAGKKISEHLGQDFSKFWEENFAVRTGEKMALHLLRYGFLQETPNSQNTLLKIDPVSFKVVDVVTRDYDVKFVVPMMEIIDPKNERFLLDQQSDEGREEVFTSITPNFRNVFFRMDEAPANLDKETLKSWRIALVRSFASTFWSQLRREKPIWRDEKTAILEIHEFVTSIVNRPYLKMYAERIRKSSQD